MKLTLRIYTGINFDGQSRGCGDDAIRVCLFGREEDGDGTVIFLGGYVKVLRNRNSPDQMNRPLKDRTTGWSAQLQKRVKKWHEFLPNTLCPECNKPLVVKQGGKGEVLGCAGWKKGGAGCNYTRNI